MYCESSREESLPWTMDVVPYYMAAVCCPDASGSPSMSGRMRFTAPDSRAQGLAQAHNARVAPSVTCLRDSLMKPGSSRTEFDLDHRPGGKCSFTSIGIPETAQRLCLLSHLFPTPAR